MDFKHKAKIVIYLESNNFMKLQRAATEITNTRIKNIDTEGIENCVSKSSTIEVLN